MRNRPVPLLAGPIINHNSDCQDTSRPMPVIGIIGGVASGKSFVAEHLRELGAKVINADQVGHEVLRDDQVRHAIRTRWGDDVFDRHGEVDRPALARIVFAGPPAGAEELRYLEQLTHPRIAERLRELITAARRADCGEGIVLDAAVLLKAGWERFCDRIVFVDAPRAVRLERARQRGWSAEQFAAREDALPPLEVQRRHADVIIDSSISPDQTRGETERFWSSISD